MTCGKLRLKQLENWACSQNVSSQIFSSSHQMWQMLWTGEAIQVFALKMDYKQAAFGNEAPFGIYTASHQLSECSLGLLGKDSSYAWLWWEVSCEVELLRRLNICLSITWGLLTSSCLPLDKWKGMFLRSRKVRCLKASSKTKGEKNQAVFISKLCWKCLMSMGSLHPERQCAQWGPVEGLICLCVVCIMTFYKPCLTVNRTIVFRLWWCSASLRRELQNDFLIKNI